MADYSFKQQTPAPRNSTQRVSRHPNAFFHFGCGIESMRVQDNEVVIRTQAGRNFVTDHVIRNRDLVNPTTGPNSLNTPTGLRPGVIPTRLLPMRGTPNSQLSMAR